MNISLSTFSAALTLLAATAVSAQESRDFDLPDFDRIDVSAGVIVLAEVGEPQTVRVETKNGDFSDFEIEVDDGALRVSREWNRLRWHDKKAEYKVFVSMPSLTALDASSGSRANISSIDTPNIFIDLSSGAHASLDGRCSDCTFDLSSGARLTAKDLECEMATIDVSSGGNGEVQVVRALEADASSGGIIAIYGSPESVKVDKSSGGRIKFKTIAQASRD